MLVSKKRKILILPLLVANNYPTTHPKDVTITDESVTGRVVVLGFVTTTHPCIAKVLRILAEFRNAFGKWGSCVGFYSNYLPFHSRSA